MKSIRNRRIYNIFIVIFSAMIIVVAILIRVFHPEDKMIAFLTDKKEDDIRQEGSLYDENAIDTPMDDHTVYFSSDSYLILNHFSVDENMKILEAVNDHVSKQDYKEKVNEVTIVGSTFRESSYKKSFELSLGNQVKTVEIIVSQDGVRIKEK